MRSLVRAITCAAAITVALTGCGSSDGGLSSAVRAKLTPLVENVRRAAQSSDRLGAGRALAVLQQAVADYQTNHDISPAKAADILGAATEVQRRLALVPGPTSTATTTTTSTPTTGPSGPPDKKPSRPGKDDKGPKGHNDD